MTSLKFHLIAASIACATTISVLATSALAEDAKEVKVAVVTGALDGLVPQLAEEEGIFKKHGLTASFIAVKSGPESVSAVASGSAEFANPSPAIAFPAIAKGGPITYLVNNYDLDYSLLAQPEVKVDEATPYPEIGKSLKGLRIGVVGRGGLSELFVKKILTDAGLNPDTDVSIIAVGAGLSAQGAFVNKQVDVLVALPPTDTVIPRADYKLVVSNQTARERVFGSDFIATGIAANSDFLKADPDATLSYCKSIVETIDFLNDPSNKDKIVGFLSKKMNLKPEQAEAVLKGYGANFNSRLTKARWEVMQKMRDDAPTWEKGVYEPCASLTTKS